MTPHNRSPDAAHTILEADAWYENEDGEYTVDCPECGSPATVSSIVEHGRCSAYLDQTQRRSEIDETALTCTARLWFELGYTVDAVDDPEDGDLDENGVHGAGEPAGSNGTV